MIRGGIVGRYYGSTAGDSSEAFDGWLPLLAVVSDGERQVMQITDYMGGEGDKPTSGQFYLGKFTITESDLSSGNATLTTGGPYLNINIAYISSDGIDNSNRIDEIIYPNYKIRIVGDNSQNFEGTISSRGNYPDNNRARIRIRRSENPEANEVPSNFPVGTVITLTIVRNVYLGATGTVTAIADAVDIRGPQKILINRSDMYTEQPGFLLF